MNRRRVLLLIVLAAISLGIWSLCRIPSRDPAVSRSKFDSIEFGMNVGEVERILGGPPGDYRTGEVELDLSHGHPELDNAMFDPEVLLHKRRVRHEWWEGDEGTAWVCFEQEKVIRKEFTPGQRVSLSFFDRVRRFIGLR